MSLASLALNDTEPRRVFPFALLGVLYTQVAVPLPALPVPLNFALPIAPAQTMPLGRTGAPPAVMLTLAATAEPALGLAGVSLALLAATVVGGDCSDTTTVAEAVLLERSGSETDIWVISARSA